MVWNKLFGGRKERESTLDPLKDLVLEKMEPGWMLDHDGRTWQVAARHCYDLGEGCRVDEWELRDASETRFLSRETEDGVSWTLTRRVPLGYVGEKLRGHILEHGDPPDAIDCEGVRYFMETYGGAEFHPHCKGPVEPLLYWEYEDEAGERVVTIEQWGDTDFEASVGHCVEEYQFINILPGKAG